MRWLMYAGIGIFGVQCGYGRLSARLDRLEQQLHVTTEQNMTSSSQTPLIALREFMERHHGDLRVVQPSLPRDVSSLGGNLKSWSGYTLDSITDSFLRGGG